MLIFLIEDVSRNIWSFILAQSYCTPLAKKQKKERRKLWQADYQRPSSFLKFFKVKIDSLRICQRHRTCIYKRDRTEIPLSKLTNIENREKVPTILKESSGKKRKKKSSKIKIMTSHWDHYLPSAAILLRISWAVLKMPRVGWLQTKHFLFFEWCWKWK